MLPAAPLSASLAHPATPRPSRFLVRAKRVLPVLALAGGLGAFFALGLNRYASLETLREHRAGLDMLVMAHALLAGTVFTLAYAAAAALSVPGALFLTLAGGLLFGTLVGTALTVVGATAGATLLFLVARSTLGDGLRGRAGGWAERLGEGFRRDAFSYLLVLRLVPVVPFFVVNLVPAFLGVPLRTYVAATLVGILPGVLVYASVGAGLSDVIEAGSALSLRGVLTPKVIVALVGLAALSLVPVIHRRITSRNR